MWLINLAISLFSIIKTKALESVSVTNQECMPRPKILDVNEGDTLCCDTLDNPMAKLCVPNIIKRINMKVIF